MAAHVTRSVSCGGHRGLIIAAFAVSCGLWPSGSAGDSTGGVAPQLPLPRAPGAHQCPGPELSNLSNTVPLALGDMAAHLFALTGGWPKVVSGLLSGVRVNPASKRHELVPLRRPADLIAWIDPVAQVGWSSQARTYGKDELHAFLFWQNCESYAWGTDLPHVPSLADVLYFGRPIKPRKTGHLDELVSMLSLETAADQLLVKAFFLTPFWGGPRGKRPLFVFSTALDAGDDQAGRGSGKTTIAQIAGRMRGGSFGIHREADWERVVSDLLSPSGLGVRFVLMDNVKALVLERISRKRHHCGRDHRPSFLPWLRQAP